MHCIICVSQLFAQLGSVIGIALLFCPPQLSSPSPARVLQQELTSSDSPSTLTQHESSPSPAPAATQLLQRPANPQPSTLFNSHLTTSPSVRFEATPSVDHESSSTRHESLTRSWISTGCICLPLLRGFPSSCDAFSVHWSPAQQSSSSHHTYLITGATLVLPR